MAALELESFRTLELSALERQILEEKAKGLSDLEVASWLFRYDREVRAITQKLMRRYTNSTPGGAAVRRPRQRDRAAADTGEGQGDGIKWAIGFPWPWWGTC